MRTFRLIGMTLLMVMLVVNFTACSDDNKESAEVKKAKEIMAKNIIEEDRKMQEQKRKRAKLSIFNYSNNEFIF